MRTPLPVTPFSYTSTNAPLAMTPDTPAFGLSEFESFYKAKMDNDESIAGEWTEDEDGLLQTVSHNSTPS